MTMLVVTHRSLVPKRRHDRLRIVGLVGAL